ncbi:rhomboid family intramembrane serine protease [Corallococcus macrosporus]|uniref:Rhomboid family protein n=1 Tax=Myxococcus fulvus (strain ATCC BAA-855 / HW-1) TaxID=483219 RepID=F8CGS3_MYXFH|nr:rhomboid family intramembrane serine protease [Corallococcus macrosporus]AEI62530.1 rhomboid family protein [Corallococcus macrosporus]
MILFLPLGVDNTELERLPRVSITIAAICVVAFFISWVIPSEPMGVGEEDLRSMLEQTLEHPDLQFPPACAERLLSDTGRRMVRNLRQNATPSDALESVENRQQALDEQCEELISRHESSLLSRFSLVPARGLVQPGWLTYMFLHFGWMHLLGNLLFFYAASLLLEDAWGRPLFAGLFVVGGLVAGIAHYAIDPASESVMVGASGAVAACMGAFCLRFARRHVRIGYFIWLLKIFRGTFPIPGWAWGGLWFGNEVLNYYLLGNNTGVAVMAHIGGFVFGFASASLLRVTQLEERIVAPALAAKQGGWVADPRLAEAQSALDRGDRAAARAGFQRLLKSQPDHTDALLALGHMDLEDGAAQAGMVRVERALHALAERASADALWFAMEPMVARLPIDRLRPASAWKLAQALDTEDAPPAAVGTTEALYSVAGSGAGVIAVRALIRATELRLAQHRQHKDLEQAAAYVARAKPLLTGEAAAEASRVEALDAEVTRKVNENAWRNRDVATTPAVEAAPAPPRIFPCRIVGLTNMALTVEAANGQRRTLAMTEVLAIAVGMLPVAGPPGTPPRQTVLTDLVLSWGSANEGPRVLRVNVAGLALNHFYPGVAPREAYARFLADMLERTSANALPDASSLKQGQYPRFNSEAELSQHFYGVSAAAA